MKKTKDFAFEFSFKIWLTSLLASPMLYALIYFGQSRFNLSSSINQLFVGWIFIVLFSFVPAVIGLFIFSFATKKAIASNFPPAKQRLLLSLTALVLIVISIFGIVGFDIYAFLDQDTLTLLTTYLLFTIGGIYFFKLPLQQNMEEEI